MIELTPEQHKALDQDSPPRVLDPLTKTVYVLVPQDVYEKVQAMLGEEDVRAMEPLLAELSPQDWEDASNYEPKP